MECQIPVAGLWGHALDSG